MNNTTANPIGMAVDSWVESLGSLCWAQDQTEKLVSSWMAQGKIAREHGRDVAKQLADQAKQNQVELQKFIHNSVALSLETLQNQHARQMTEMQNQVRQMGEMMEDLQRRVEVKE